MQYTEPNKPRAHGHAIVSAGCAVRPGGVQSLVPFARQPPLLSSAPSACGVDCDSEVNTITCNIVFVLLVYPSKGQKLSLVQRVEYCCVVAKPGGPLKLSMLQVDFS